MMNNDDRGGRGKNHRKFADVICERPLTLIPFLTEITLGLLYNLGKVFMVRGDKSF